LLHPTCENAASSHLAPPLVTVDDAQRSEVTMADEAADGGEGFSALPLPPDQVGLLEGLTTTRAIRRYRDLPVGPAALQAILFAATRAPSGSNRQPFRFVVLTDGPNAERAKALLGEQARRLWAAKETADSYESGSGATPDSPKSRLARSMRSFVENFERVPVVIFPCLLRYRAPNPTEGASVYPACQNILLAARALGYGGVMTGWQHGVEAELRELLGLPDEVFLAATITLGVPVGNHGPVRRRPMGELVFEERWGEPAPWALDPPGTDHTSAGPPSPGGRGKG